MDFIDSLKQICLLHFNVSNKWIAFLLSDGEREFSPIPAVVGIYAQKARILDAVKTANGNK